MKDTTDVIRDGLSLTVNDEMAIRSQGRVYAWSLCHKHSN